VEREALLNQLGARDFTKLAEQFDASFAKAKAQKDPDEKRHAIARLLVALVDALPTDDEKKQRIEDAKKPPNQRPDPTADPNYQKMLGAVGARAVAAALDEQADALLRMPTDVRVGRDDARRRFADTHDAGCASWKSWRTDCKPSATSLRRNRRRPARRSPLPRPRRNRTRKSRPS